MKLIIKQLINGVKRKFTWTDKRRKLFDKPTREEIKLVLSKIKKPKKIEYLEKDLSNVSFPEFISVKKALKLYLRTRHPEKEEEIELSLKMGLIMFFLVKIRRKKYSVPNVSALKPLKNKNWENYNVNACMFESMVQLALGMIKILNPFWDEDSSRISSTIWLPQGDQVSNENFTIPNDYEIKGKEVIPDYIKYHKGTDEPKIFKNTKVKLYPDLEQRKILRNWFGAARYMYNKCLHAIKNEGAKINFQNLRNTYVTLKRKYKQCICCGSESLIKEDDECCALRCYQNFIVENPINPWELEIPKEIRAGAIKKLVKAYQLNLDKFKKGTLKKFSMRYKKKEEIQSIVIPKASLESLGRRFNIYKKTLGKVKSKEVYDIKNDTEISYYNGDYFIHIIQQVEPKEIDNRQGVVALDPGLRSFVTGYSEYEVFERKLNLDKLRKRIDLLVSLRAKKKLTNERKVKKAIKNLSNKVDDLHWQTINHLVKNYSVILLPEFKSQELMKFSNSRNNRSYGDLKHFQFKQRLSYKASCFKDTKLYQVSEEYTSKTCSKCGKLNFSLGGNKVFHCKNCDLVIDRDINGARNIFIKNVC